VVIYLVQDIGRVVGIDQGLGPFIGAFLCIYVNIHGIIGMLLPITSIILALDNRK
jgi:hypothetical protein